MKKHYLNPSLEVVEIRQRGCILAGSVGDVDSNADVEYGGGGNGTGIYEPMSREYDMDDDY